MAFKMICLGKLSLAKGALLFGGFAVPCDMGIQGLHDARGLQEVTRFHCPRRLVINDCR
jgi:hypothetical protein